MSELEDLGDIADQCALGRGGLAHRSVGKKPPVLRCCSPDHMKGENIRLYRVKNKFRAGCKLCDKARRRGKPTYTVQGYPL